MFFTRDRSFYKSVFAIAIPVALQNVVSVALNMADTVMLGMLETGTEQAISAAGYANQTYFLYSLFIFGMCSGSAVLISQYWGKRDFESINRVTGIALILAVGLGVLFSAACIFFSDGIISIFTKSSDVAAIGGSYLRIVAFSYVPVTLSLIFGGSLRATEQVKIVLFTNVGAVAVNIFLNYVLIFGKFGAPELGIDGAAYATLISRLIECVIIVFYVVFAEKRVNYRLSIMLRPGKALLGDFFKYCLPVIFNETLWGLGITIHSVVIGNLGEDVYSAYTIANVLERIGVLFSFGCANASAIIIGREIGAGRTKRIMEYTRTLLFFSASSVFVAFSVIVLIREPIIGFYNISAGTANTVSTLLVYMLFIITLKGFNTCAIVGVIRAGGDTVTAMLTDIISMYCLAIPLGFIVAFVLKAPIYFVYVALMSDEISKTAFVIKHIASGKWIKNLTRERSE